MNFELQQILTHALGFLLTVWILKRYAWGPLMNIMEERRSRIAGEFETIEKEKGKVAAMAAEYEAKLKQIESERRQKLVEAVTEGKRIAEDLKAQARDEAREIAQKARTDLEREVAKARVELKEQMVAITMGAAEKLLREKLDDARHRQLIGRFIDSVEKA
ncbi:MAG TPA: F0F1 ATP synthase subunit B [candidate division Zixibacteria bacterium]|nr:F0F1 ATP synthase subunit B [candidate division Zixibacteria bacterium]MDD4918785.1 F0F1 ATP synthase subunit B [candidate division Zixibacteria bacterium]MDM7973018.1 F0F1 ATP synthase subunit B [candidate division Zixibacteria bacterium]HOD65985.1 F0F1 ATP synthase subunit B [candidate division Zixibacteria bacterium]HOZ08832.1 F0F1 ATP synthase subunit B [candidate division Zixibacteria bacterium]